MVAKVVARGGKITVLQMKVKGMRKLGDADIEVKFKGTDVATLFNKARQTAQTLAALKHFANVHVAMGLSKPGCQVKIDRVRVAEMGVALPDVARTQETPLGGAMNVLVYLMIYPMMIGLDLAQLPKVVAQPRSMLVSLIYNFVLTSALE